MLKDFPRNVSRGSARCFAIAGREEEPRRETYPRGRVPVGAKSVPFARTGAPHGWLRSHAACYRTRPFSRGTLIASSHRDLCFERGRVFPVLVSPSCADRIQESGQWDGGFTLANERDAYLTFVQVAERHAFRQYHRCRVGLNHLAFKVKGRDAVDRLRQYCLENGIPSLYDEKYPFANGGTEYYALYVEDPDRIKIEFVAD